MISPRAFTPRPTGDELPTGAAPTRAQRFTLDGSDQLERALKRTCSEVRNAVLGSVSPDRVDGILLGGGYGRGEGGVLQTETGDQPYNDLEFYVALRGHRLLNERRYGSVLHDLAHELSLIAGIEVEFKIISLSELRRAAVTMFSYDLIMGHRWVYGDDRLLIGCEPHREAEHIPLAEATRLLMNRCSGLLFARERLAQATFTESDADFVARNLAKARLALGDAVLAALGRYHWSCCERHRRLHDLRFVDERPSWLPALLAMHEAGVKFKLHPQRRDGSHADLREEHRQLSASALDVWLWLESRRLGHPFTTARDYALDPINKCPDTRAWRNCAINFRTFGLRGIATTRALRYPRERLFNALALLLWEPACLRDPRLRTILRRQLCSDAHTPQPLTTAYTAVWSKFR